MITTKFVGVVGKSNDTPCEVPINVALTYDVDVDPFAVQMVLTAEGGPEEVVWFFAHDLLAQGVDSRTVVGDGDVRFRRKDLATVIVCLRNATGHADILLPAKHVQRFLKLSAEQAPGSAFIESELDEFIEEILGS
jgi:sporulation and cell division protein SsgA